MMKQTVCLLLFLALVAQICAIPHDKDDAEKQAKAAADKGSAEGKGKVGAAAAEAEHVAEDASDAKDKVARAASDVKDDAEKFTNGEHHQDHAKDCHKPGTGGKPTLHGLGDHPISKGIKVADKIVTGLAEKTVKAATNFWENLGL